MATKLVSDAIMEASKLKPLLSLSKREPVNAAIALSASGDGLLLLDKKAKPRKVAALLRSAAAKAKIQLNPSSVRFGRAEVDPDYDAATVRFFVNKEAPGPIRLKLIEVVKQAAFQKVELNVDASLEEESDEEEGSAETVAGPQAQAEAPPAPPPPAPPSQPQPQAQPEAAPRGMDIAGVKRILAGLIARVAQAAAERKPELVRLANEANGAIKSEDLKAAAVAVKRLSDALAGPVAGPQAPAGDPLVRVRDARAAWLKAMDTVNAQIGALAKALQGSGDADLAEIASTGLMTVTGGFRTKMMAALAETGDSDLAKIRKSGGKAAGFAEKLREQIEADARVAACDDNDFGVEVSIAKTLGPALGALSSALRDAARA